MPVTPEIWVPAIMRIELAYLIMKLYGDIVTLPLSTKLLLTAQCFDLALT